MKFREAAPSFNFSKNFMALAWFFFIIIIFIIIIITRISTPALLGCESMYLYKNKAIQTLNWI